MALCPGPRTGLLDHLIPLCEILHMPLAVQDPWVETAAEMFYPPIWVFDGSEGFGPLCDAYHTLYTVESCRLYAGAYRFGEEIYHGEQRSVCGLHGHSDKFRQEYWAEQLIHEDMILLYGPEMVHFLKTCGIFERLKAWVYVGNYRYAYYMKHRAFFDAKVAPFLPDRQGRMRILYAPTWSFPQEAGFYGSPFFEQIENILRVPDDFQLIVKLHPFMYRLFPEVVIQLQRRYTSDHIVVLEDIPLVYPFLTQVDAYLGDYSSVGYDFLAMDRPLFLLTPGPIAEAGTCIHDVTTLYQTIAKTPDRHAEARQRLYRWAFGESVTLEDLAERLP